MNQLERNSNLFKNQLIETIDSRIAFGKKLIEAELKSNLFDVILKPIVNTFYEFYSKDARKGILKQIELIIKCGKNFLINELNEEIFKSEVDNLFPEYLKGDQFSGMCKKNHKNYSELKTLLKEVFVSEIKESMLLLNIKEDVNDYDSLIRVAFKTKEEAYKTLIIQLNMYDECLRIIEKDLSILTFPTGRKRIFKILKKGQEESNRDFIRNLDVIYII